MKPFSILFGALCVVATMQAATVSYTADDSSIFPNPERGFIIMLEGHLTKKAPYAVKGQENTLEKNMSKDQISLVLVHYYLDNFVTTSTLPDEILNAFDTDMQVLRDKGLKAIVRFSYTNKTYENGKGEESAKDATLAIAQSHISQYKSHWQANSDVIFVFQAGFIGAWGEWYYTDNYGNQEGKMNANRKALVDALLDAVPQDRCIQLRTPLFKTGYVGPPRRIRTPPKRGWDTITTPSSIMPTTWEPTKTQQSKNPISPKRPYTYHLAASPVFWMRMWLQAMLLTPRRPPK